MLPALEKEYRTIDLKEYAFNAIGQEKNEEFNFAMVENYAEDGEESAPKSVNDSENTSHAGEDILGSELKWPWMFT